MANVYIMIELSDRELPGKWLLALKLAAQGHKVVIGQQWALMRVLHKIPRGLAFFKGLNVIYHQAFRLAKQVGHTCLAQDEEFFGNADPNKFIEAISAKELGIIDGIFSNTRIEQEKWLAMGYSNTIFTGNLRGDIIGSFCQSTNRKKINYLRGMYGNFVLINSNFGYLHSLWGNSEQVFSAQCQSGFYKTDNPSSLTHFKKMISRESFSRDTLLSFIRAFRSKDDRVIVIRPHPAEDPKKWSSIVGQIPNIHVIREGHHLPWTLACDVLIHTGCTTGAERQAAGGAAIALLDPAFGPYELESPYWDMQPVAYDAETLLRLVQSRQIKAHSSVKELFGIDPDATALEQMTREIEKLATQHPTAPLKGVKFGEDVPQLFRKMTITPTQVRHDLTLAAATLEITTAFTVREIHPLLYEIDAAPGAHSTYEFLPSSWLREQQSVSAQSSGSAYKDFFLEHFGDLYKHAEAYLTAAETALKRGDIAFCNEVVDQWTALAAEPDWRFLFVRARARWASGDRESAQQALEQIANLTKHPALAVMNRKVSAAPVTTVLADSHGRYFRWLQNSAPRGDEPRRPVKVFDIGGASAYGLGNLESRSGAAKLLESKECLAWVTISDQLIFMFGEIDCRRALWRAATDLGEPVDTLLEGAISNLIAFMQRAASIKPDARIYSLRVKPPIADDDMFEDLVKADDRYVRVSLKDRVAITQRFNTMLANRSRDAGFTYVDVPEFDQYEQTDGRLSELQWSLRGDTHGDISVVAGLYRSALRRVGVAI